MCGLVTTGGSVCGLVTTGGSVCGLVTTVLPTVCEVIKCLLI